MHKNGKDRACGSRDILEETHTHRHTHTHTQIYIIQQAYFATATAGDVINIELRKRVLEVKRNVLSPKIAL